MRFLVPIIISFIVISCGRSPKKDFPSMESELIKLLFDFPYEYTNDAQSISYKSDNMDRYIPLKVNSLSKGIYDFRAEIERDNQTVAVCSKSRVEVTTSVTIKFETCTTTDKFSEEASVVVNSKIKKIEN